MGARRLDVIMGSRAYSGWSRLLTTGGSEAKVVVLSGGGKPNAQAARATDVWERKRI